MITTLIAWNGTLQFGQFLGDSLVSLKVAWLIAQNEPADKFLLALSPKGQLNFLWDRFIKTYNVEVIYDNFDPGNDKERFAAWDQWEKERRIYGRDFDVYREIYRRIDGGHRQSKLCGGEVGLGRKNVFEYFLYGQKEAKESYTGTDSYGSDLIWHDPAPPEWDVLIAPDAKCQGNDVFTHAFWEKVVRRLVTKGVSVTVNRSQAFMDDLTVPHYRRIFPPFEGLRDEVCRHRLVCCGNTGVGWLAGACGIPLLAMQHPESHMQDYRYEWCGVKSLLEFVEKPDHEYVVGRIIGFLQERTVLTTGCYDLLHAGHVRHLEESKSLGDRLVVALNSDASVRRSKGEGRPIRNESDRAEVLKALRCVDDVIVFDGDDALDLIHEIRPAVLTNGSDHKAEEVVGRDFVESCGGRVVITGGERQVSTTSIIRKITGVDVAKAVRDAARYSPNPEHKLRLMADQLLSVESVEGALADVGAYKGACSLIMRRLSRKRLHVFDTWDGAPFDDPLCHHKKGEWKADMAECKKLVELTVGYPTVFHKGVFPDSANGMEETFSFAYVDVDTYQSTKAALEWLWPRMAVGGKVMLDDVPWGPCAGVEKAVDEVFTKEQQKRFPEANTTVVTKW